MKLVLFDDYKPGVLQGDAVVDISDAVRSVAGHSPQETMEGIISNFGSLRPDLERLAASGRGTPLANLRLRAPLPKPGKIMAMGANFREFTTGVPPLPIWGFFKSPQAILDPGGTIVLPRYEFVVCHHEAEMVVVIGKEGKDIPRERAMEYVFGYTNGIDVSARDKMLQNTLLGKSNDTFAPIGPAIVTADEVADPHALQVRLSIDGELHQDYNMSDIGHPIENCIQYFSARTTLKPGDLLFLGTNHAGLGALQDGGAVDMEIEGFGHLLLSVSDPLKRTWPRGTDPGYAHYRLRDTIMAAAGAGGASS